jgi:ComF family protein
VPILDLLLTLLYPPRCASCARELRRTPPLGLCRGCLAELGTIGPGCPSCGEPGSTAPCARCRRAPPAFRSARACFVYREGALSSSLVTRWKYQRDHVLGAALAALLAAHRKRQADCYDVVVPVPLHASRLVTRGFNQAALLAQAVRLPGERVAARALHRASRTPPQAALDRAARERNVAAAFAADDAAALGGRSVLLIDDVLTTGATARACAAALRSAGAAVVDVWTLARTARPLGPAAVTPGRPAATQPADVPT